MDRIKRKIKEREFKKKIIAEAANKLFLEKGFEATTMSDIAKKSGFAKGTLYLYFCSKDRILAYIRDDIFDIIHNNFFKLMESDLTFLEKFDKTEEIYNGFFQNVVLRYGTNLLYKLIDDEQLMEKHCKTHHKELDLLTALIKGLQDEGWTDKSLDPTKTAIMITSYFSGIVETITRVGDYLEEKNIDKATLIKEGFEILREILIKNK